MPVKMTQDMIRKMNNGYRYHNTEGVVKVSLVVVENNSGSRMDG